jgi:hypothetical protein
VIELTELTPVAEEAWWVLIELMERRPDSCLLIGGQMMLLLAAEHGGVMPRATEDVDVVVDLRAHKKGTEWLSTWLVDRGFEMSRPSADNVGHRFLRPAEVRPGRVVVDVLASSAIGRQKLALTRPPARTVQAPGSSSAFARSGLVDVRVSGISGREPRQGLVRRPALLGALVMKAAGLTEILVRANRDRDWQDVALLLSLVADPLATAEQCTARDRKRLRGTIPLLDRGHVGWSSLEEESFRRGATTLEFLIA